jgi:AcrR family transcriptional regulator
MSKRDAENTKLRLIETAERLFADRGLDGVSLRQINVASGQRNASALHYHFGSRESLIEAIFVFRMSRIDARRCEMIDDVIAAGRQNDLRALMETKILPLSEQLDPSFEGNNYLRFFCEVRANPKIDFRKFVAGKYDIGVTRANNLIIAIQDHLPENLVRRRLYVETGMIINALADLESLMAARGHRVNSADVELAVNNIIDMAVGAINCPASQRVLQLAARE